MIRRFFSRRLPNADLHPDQSLAPLEQEPAATEVFFASSSAKGKSEHLHPDLDWDLAFADAQQEPTPDVLNLAISLDELQEEEDAAAQVPHEAPDIIPSEQMPANDDIDWHLETAWAGASGASSLSDDTDLNWETFDFDVADLGPDPEAQAEDIDPTFESETVRERKLDVAAANLVLSLGAFRIADRRELHRRFRAVVEEFQHPASHAALHRLLSAGISLEEIEEASQLRCIWRDQPWLWAEKRSVLSNWTVRRGLVHRLAFGWPTAVRLVRRFGLVEAERAMREDWFDAWTGLERTKATTPAEEAAFFTYAGFLRQMTPALLLDISEGVGDEPIDGPERPELRDIRGNLVWKFERKLPARTGELSQEPARIRNHREFVEAACETKFGLPGLVSLEEAEATESGFCRSYQFPERAFEGAVGARAKISSLVCHGAAKIVALDLKACRIRLAVPHDQKRLLTTQLALISDPPPPADVEKDQKTVKQGKNKEKTK